MTIKKPVLDSDLLQVSKPGRYIGNEVNVIKKDHKDVDVTVALFFPDIYELGMSYQGFQILYHVLNEEDFIAAERVYSPWIDFEQKLRDNDKPLYSLESKKPVCSFDIVGFTLQYELHATNILNGLDLSRIPIFQWDRVEGDPIVIAGGPNAANPEPLADFFDVIVLGDGEVVSVEIARTMQESKRQGWDRNRLLQELAKLEGVYIPVFYKPLYDERGRFVDILPEDSSAKLPVKGRNEQLNKSFYSTKPVIPFVRATHNRLNVEVMRGCTRGCRFCHAGYHYRPSRERSANEIANHVQEGIKNTGYEELSLISLSTSDYSQLALLWWRLKDFLSEHHVSLSLPSLRPETITPDLLEVLRAEKKSGLTLAPEAGTQRLRNVINKATEENEIFRAVKVAFEHGWKLVKLYFMIGLPTETEEELLGISELVNRIGTMARSFGAKVKVSISPFTPKAQTPFQWIAQDDILSLEQKVQKIRTNVRGKNIQLNWRDPKVTRLEGIIARGDRKISQVIYHAWRLGARFDAWTDQFDWNIWLDALKRTHVDVGAYVRAYESTKKLPWHHLNFGVSEQFLQKEWERALDGSLTKDCELSTCNRCGLMDEPNCREILRRGESDHNFSQQSPVFHWPPVTSPKKNQTVACNASVCYVRLKYAKTGLMRFIGHLDLMAFFQRVFRMAQLPLVYSIGFSPHPRMSFCPPLPLGMESWCEYLDVQLYQNMGNTLKERLNNILPDGLEILQVWEYDEKPISFEQMIERIVYQVELPEMDDWKERVDRFNFHDQIWFEKKTKRGRKWTDLKEFVKKIDYMPEKAMLDIELAVNRGKTVKIIDVFRDGLCVPADRDWNTYISRKFMGAETEWHNMQDERGESLLICEYGHDSAMQQS